MSRVTVLQTDAVSAIRHISNQGRLVLIAAGSGVVLLAAGNGMETLPPSSVCFLPIFTECARK